MSGASIGTRLYLSHEEPLVPITTNQEVEATATALVREDVGGEPYEYYPLGQLDLLALNEGVTVREQPEFHAQPPEPLQCVERAGKGARQGFVPWSIGVCEIRR